MSKKSIKFAKLELMMFNSVAYQDLSRSAWLILHYMLFQLIWSKTSKRNKIKPKYTVTNKDEILLMYRTFTKEPYKLSNASISKAIDSLLAHGFIEIKEQGGRCKGNKTIYSQSDKWETWKSGQTIFKREPFGAKGFCNSTDKYTI